jgi:hypothetical protein
MLLSLGFANSAFAESYKYASSSRKNSLTYSLGFLSTSTTASGTTSSTTNLGPVTATYLWVFDNFEVGPTVSFSTGTSSSGSGSSSSTSTTNLGAYGFYDIVANKPGVVAVPSIFIKAINSSATAGNSIQWGFGGEYDYFIVDRIAVLASLEYDSISGTSNSVNYTTTGFVAGTGFKITF